MCIRDRVRALGRQAQQDLREQFDRIDAIAEENSIRVLEAFQDLSLIHIFLL